MWWLNNLALALGAVIMILVLVKLDRFIERHNKQRWRQARWHVLIMAAICVWAALQGIWWAAFVSAAVVGVDGWMWARRWE